MSIYGMKVNLINGEELSLSQFKGKVLIIANTASKCGFTPQYEGLQKIYDKYHAAGLEILGVPCNQFMEQEPGTEKEVKSFCELNYGVSFHLTEKTDVRGENAHPLFQYLTSQIPFQGFDLNHPLEKILSDMLKEKFSEWLANDSIKWNFTKFLIDREGNVGARFEPTSEPEEMISEIEKLLKL